MEGSKASFRPVPFFNDRHASLQRRKDKSLPHRFCRHAAGKPGAAEIDRPLLMDAAIDGPVGDECIKRILR